MTCWHTSHIEFNASTDSTRSSSQAYRAYKVAAKNQKWANNMANSRSYSDRNFRGINSLQRDIYFSEYIPIFLLNARIVKISIVMYVYTQKNVLYQKRLSNLQPSVPYWNSLMRVRWAKCLMPPCKTCKNTYRWIFSNFSIEYLRVKKCGTSGCQTYVSRFLACHFWQHHIYATKVVPLDRGEKVDRRRQKLDPYRVPGKSYADRKVENLT